LISIWNKLKIKQRKYCKQIPYRAYWNQTIHNQKFKHSSSLDQRSTSQWSRLPKSLVENWQETWTCAAYLSTVCGAWNCEQEINFYRNKQNGAGRLDIAPTPNKRSSLHKVCVTCVLKQYTALLLKRSMMVNAGA